MSKAIRITINAVRFGAGVALFIARCPLAVLVGVVGVVDRMIEALVSAPTEGSWFASIGNKFKQAVGEYVVKVCLVVAPAAEMIMSAWAKFKAWDF